MPVKTTSISIARPYLLTKLPSELVDYILEFVYQPLIKELMKSITNNFKIESIWWNPSERLLGLCKDNGVIQTGHFSRHLARNLEWCMNLSCWLIQ